MSPLAFVTRPLESPGSLLACWEETAVPPQRMSEVPDTPAASAGPPRPDAFLRETHRREISAALDAGEVTRARTLLAVRVAEQPTLRLVPEWAVFWDLDSWPDAWLIAAVRGDRPDEAALDALAGRHWRNLFARCHMLTLDREKAADLAQDAWCRILRARHALRADGNFPAYLATVATNLWRDRYRAERRAGAMGDSRMLSLQATPPASEGDGGFLGELLPDLDALAAAEQARLKLDLDQALLQLSPLLRDVLVARYLEEESCAAIGRRYGRTEQAVSGWVRQAIREIRNYLQETGRDAWPRKPKQ